VATHRVTTENAPFADRNKNFLPFLKTFEIASTKKAAANCSGLQRLSFFDQNQTQISF